MKLKLLGVGGSLRMCSYSTIAVRKCLDMAQERGAETRLMDLRVLDLPMFRPDADTVSDNVTEVRQAVRWADAFLLASPDYHGSMSGAVKNFLDYHWKEFTGKLFGYLCSSHEKGLTAMDQMRTAVRQCYGWSLPYGVALHGEHDFDKSGAITNPRLEHRLTMMVRDLVVYGVLLRGQLLQDQQMDAADTFAARSRKSH